MLATNEVARAERVRAAWAIAAMNHETWKQQEAEWNRQAEADRVAQTEANRLAQAEADRVAKADADRAAQEKADRAAREEADRLAADERERKRQSERGNRPTHHEQTDVGPKGPSPIPDLTDVTRHPISTGSGFCLTSDGYFLTCAHVVQDGRAIAVRANGRTCSATLIQIDRKNDLALLRLDGAGFHPLPLSQSLPEMGDKVFTIGFPNPEIQGAAPKYSDGAISALSGIQDDIRTMQVTVPIQSGNSGGPLVDVSGSAIGLVVAQLNAVTVFEYTGALPQNVNFAVKINYAMPLIQAVPGLSKRLPRPPDPEPANAVKAVEAATGLVLVYE